MMQMWVFSNAQGSEANHFMNKCFLYRDLEEDPLFGDDLSPERKLSGSDWLSTSPPQSPDHSKSEGKTEVHKIVNRCAVCSW